MNIRCYVYRGQIHTRYIHTLHGKSMPYICESYTWALSTKYIIWAKNPDTNSVHAIRCAKEKSTAENGVHGENDVENSIAVDMLDWMAVYYCQKVYFFSLSRSLFCRSSWLSIQIPAVGHDSIQLNWELRDFIYTLHTLSRSTLCSYIHI